MIVLDTNVVSELMKPHPSERVESWVAAQARDRLFATTITQAEILYGGMLLPAGRRRAELMAKTKILFEERLSGQLLVFDSDAARHFAEIAAERRRTGRPIGAMDAQIAGIARSRGAMIATRDVQDFADCGIELINPWSA